MFDIHRVELDWGGRKLTLETGRIARQADGAVLATYGETTVLCTAVAMKKSKPGQDFFPLTVNYQEKTFAAGKIPGGFFKREGRPSEKETLTSRLIDRPIRPLFHKSFRNETQVICTVLSHDMENDPDIVSLVGASAALTISGVPFLGPIGGARVGYINGEYVLNPQIDELANSALDMVVAGTADALVANRRPAGRGLQALRLPADAAGAGPLGPSQLIKGAPEVVAQARRFARLARFARPVHVNGIPGFLIAPDGKPLALIGLAIRGDKITEIDILADPERLSQLDLTGLIP